MTERIYALILCGGLSSRMGADKALLPLGGATLLERAAAFWLARPEIGAVLAAVGTPEHGLSLPAGVTPVYDVFPGAGPMAGLHAAFVQTDAEALYVSAVDMPYLTPDALPPLPGGDAVVCTKNGRPDPLLGVYRRSCLPALTAALERGDRRMTALLEELDAEYRELPEDCSAALGNLNTRADYLRALAGSPPAVCVMGWSGAGKTTFLEKLIPALTGRGLRVAVVKHDGHGFALDRPGKDTWRFTQAGAAATAISGPDGWAVMSREDIALADLLRKLPPADIVLVEGHKLSPLPKLQVFRAAAGKPFLDGDPAVFAVVTDDDPPTALPRVGLDDAEAAADLLCGIFLPEKNYTAGVGLTMMCYRIQT